MTALHVVCDYPALERFAYDLFARVAEQPDRAARPAARLHAAALDPGRLARQMPAPASPSIPLAFRLWLAHLLWLEEVLQTFDCRPADLTAVELAGLQAVARARQRFLRAHQFCTHCDAPNPRWTRARGDAAPRCRRCHHEL